LCGYLSSAPFKQSERLLLDRCYYSQATDFQSKIIGLVFCANLCKHSSVNLLCVCFQEKVAKAQEVKDIAMAGLAQAIEDEKKEQWRAEGRSMLFDAKRVSSLDVCFFIVKCLHCS